MAERMQRMWAPIDTGVLSLPAGDTSALLLLSELESSLGREIRQFTVTRIIARIRVTPVIDDNPVYMIHGVRIENENVPADGISPRYDETADWILHGTVYASGDAARWEETNTVVIDNRSQRKSQGEQSELRWYVENSGLTNMLYYSIQGRALVLLP